MSLPVRPGGSWRCYAAGSSLFAAVSSGDGGQTVFVEWGGSSPAPSWREPDSDAPHPGPESALRYFGNERWGGPRARQSWKGTGLLLEGGAGLVLGSGSLMDQEPV